jgi:hypothetical protein
VVATGRQVDRIYRSVRALSGKEMQLTLFGREYKGMQAASAPRNTRYCGTCRPIDLKYA